MSVVIETTLGDITVDLFLHQRPVTCLNFLKLCKMKYYNFNLFHSIRSGFIAQTGDPTGEGTNGESVFGVLEGPEKRFFSGEKLPKIRHSNTGTLSMVCTGDMMVGSQFFFTLAPDLDSLDSIHCVIGEVTEGHDVLRKLNDVICDEKHRPYRDVRITHTVVLEDPFNDPAGLHAPSRSPSPNAERLKGGRIAPDEDIDEAQGKSAAEIQEMIEEKEAKARATILEIVGDLPDADIAPPENVLFVCKLNPVTSDEDLEIIFSRFGTIVSCEVIRDKKTGDSLQYAFVEFSDKKSCEDAYFKMDNVLIDDRRIHVDFSQSVSKMRYLGKGRGVQYLNDNKESALPAKSDKYSKHPDNDELRNGRTDKKHESRETDRSKDRHPRKDRHSSRDRSRKGSRSRHRHSPKRNRRSRSRSRRSRSRDRKHNRKDKGRDRDKSRDRKRRSPHSKSSKSHHDRSSDTRRNKSEAKDSKKSRDKSPSHSKKSSQYTDRKVKLQSSRHKNSRSHSKSPANHRRTQENSGNSKRTRKSRSRSPIEIINGPEQENSDVPSKKSESNIESGKEQCNNRKRDTEKTADLDQTTVIQSEEKVYGSESKSFSEKYEGADVELNKQNIMHNWQEAAENAQLRTEIHQQTKNDPKFEQHNGEDDLQTQRLTSDTKEKKNSISRSRSSSSVERENSKLGSKNKYENKQQPSNDLNEIRPVFSENSANISVSQQESNNHKKDHGYERPQGKKYTNSETEPSQHFSDKQAHNESRRQSHSVERQRKDSQRIHEASQKQKDINKSKEERAREYSYEQNSGKEEEDLRQKPRGSNTDTHKENRSSSTSSDIAELKEKKQDKVKNQGLKEISSNEELKSHKEISKYHKDESKDQSKQVSKKSKDKKIKKVSTSKTKDLKKTDKRDKKVASKKKRKYSTSSSSSDSSDSSSSESSSSSEDERKKKRRKRKVSTSSSSSDSSSSSSSSSSDSSSSSSESEPSRKKRKKVCHTKVSKKSRKSTKIK